MERVEALSAREAVAGWTPAFLATSFSVARCTRAQYPARGLGKPVAASPGALPASTRDGARDTDDHEHAGAAGELQPQVPAAEQMATGGGRRGVAREEAGREEGHRG